ncbi:MAG: hypothetical protein E7E98_12740, partial [Cutibacterium avidum]|nr:hypothetical protein [Cutibacterium avidum]
ANKFYVLISAARANLSHEENKKRHFALFTELNQARSKYGAIDGQVIGCYREEGQEVAQEENTIRVLCDTYGQVMQCCKLAGIYDQDCIMVYRSQTHTASLMFPGGMIGLSSQPLNGSFQEVDKPTGENYTRTVTGRYWEVI